MGPVLIVYPFDRDSSLWTESVFTRCVLQLGAVYVGTPGSVPLASLLPGEQSPAGLPRTDTSGNDGGGVGGASNQAGGPDTGIGGNGDSGQGAGQQQGTNSGGGGTGTPTGGKGTGAGTDSAVHSGGGGSVSPQ